MSLLFQTSPATAFADTAPEASARGRAGCGASLTSPRGGLGSLCREGEAGVQGQGEPPAGAPGSWGFQSAPARVPRRHGSVLAGPGGKERKANGGEGAPSVLQIFLPVGLCHGGGCPGSFTCGPVPAPLPARRTAGESLGRCSSPRLCRRRAQGWPCPRGQPSSLGPVSPAPAEPPDSAGALREGPGATALLRLAGSWGRARAGRHIRGAEKPRVEGAWPGAAPQTRPPAPGEAGCAGA